MSERGFDGVYPTVDGSPYLPVVNRINFAAFFMSTWASLLSMAKANGATVIYVDVVWSNHQPSKGEDIFIGQKNLRDFLLTCREMGLDAILCVGPYNTRHQDGGYPMWVSKLSGKAYAEAVACYFARLARQINGLYAQDGGPVLGVTIECAPHMDAEDCEIIRRLAMEVNLIKRPEAIRISPYQQTVDADVKKQFLFTPQAGGRICAGMQLTHYQRCIAKAHHIYASALIHLAGGDTCLNFGRVQFPGMDEIASATRMISLFAQDFGPELLTMQQVECAPCGGVEDTQTLRTAVRHNGSAGYLFVNNTQPQSRMAYHSQKILSVVVGDDIIVYPPQDIADGASFFYPFNMQLSQNLLLKCANATPLCILRGWEKPIYVFYAEHTPTFALEGDEDSVDIISIPHDKAMLAHKVTHLGKDYLFVTRCALYHAQNGWHLQGTGDAEIETFPALPKPPSGFTDNGVKGRWHAYSYPTPQTPCHVQVSPPVKGEQGKRYTLTITSEKIQQTDLLLTVEGAFDTGVVFFNDKPAGRRFSTGEPWQLYFYDMKLPLEVGLQLLPMNKNDRSLHYTYGMQLSPFDCELQECRAEVFFNIHFRL